MKKLFILLLIMSPVLATAQGHKGTTEACAPMKNGKVCYTDSEEIEGKSRNQIFNAINKWAKKTYGKDVFISNATSNKSKGTIFISSRVELLLNETDKTVVKFKMSITCSDGEYNIEVKDISYLYDPNNKKDYQSYAAENVIANNGKSNTVAIIKDPKLFCNATFFFVENLFADVYLAADGQLNVK